jgi:predicted Fe-Mo cluster-binding NifX family protein
LQDGNKFWRDSRDVPRGWILFKALFALRLASFSWGRGGEWHAFCTLRGVPKGIAMKVAIPTFGERVSPRFDCAAYVRIVSLEGETVVEQTDLCAAKWSPRERVDRLRQMGVDEVVCGGIDCWSSSALTRAGIRVHGWVCGTVADALEAWRRGELASTREAGQPGRWRGEACRGGRGRAP